MKKRNLRKKKNDSESGESPAGSHSQPKGILSFDVEEEPTVSVKKRKEPKPWLVHKLSKETETLPQTFSQISTEDAYTAERLEEMKRASVGVKRNSTLPPASTVKVTGSFKPASTERVPEAFVRVQNKTQEKKEPTAMEIDEDAFTPPNSQIIKMAKAKRERLRQAQLAPDYLPLGGASNLLSQDFPQSDRRESSESDAEEDCMRIQFAGKPTSLPKADEEMDLDLMEDEDAVDRFVDAQIKKGMTTMGNVEGHIRKKKAISKVKDEVITLPIVRRTTIVEEAETTTSRLRNEIQRLRQLQKTTQTDLERARNQKEDARRDLTQFESEDASIAERYRYVQELRAYVGDLCACLKEKLPFIEEMEDQLQKLSESEADLQSEALLDKEDRALAEAASNAVLKTLSNQGSFDDASQAAEKAVEMLEAELDPSRERFQKRRQRWHLALIDPNSLQFSHASNAAIDEALPEIERAVEELFSDTLPEFRSVSAVLSKFADLKQRYPKLYEMAYVPDGLPALLAPYVRIQTLTWNPLHGTELGLENQSWYKELEKYGDEKEEHILPELMKQIVLPVVLRRIQKCWSPFSPTESAIVAEMVREMLVFVLMNTLEMQKLIQSLKEKLVSSVEAGGVPPYPASALSASETVRAVAETQFRKTLDLIRSLNAFRDIFPESFLVKWTMLDLVCENVLPYLRCAVQDPTSALLKVLELKNALPSSYLTADVCPLETIQISDMLKTLSRALQKNRKHVRKFRKELKELIDLLILLGNDACAKALHDNLLVLCA